MPTFALRAVVACVVLTSLWEAVLVSAQTTPTLYVSTSGDDSWSGALPEPNADGADGPFATREAARDELRRLDCDGATVVLRGGAYFSPVVGDIHDVMGRLGETTVEANERDDFLRAI